MGVIASSGNTQQQVMTVRGCDIHKVNQVINEQLAFGWEMRGNLFVIRDVDHAYNKNYNDHGGPEACHLYVQQMVRMVQKQQEAAASKKAPGGQSP